MALTGEQTFRGLTISNAYVRVMNADHIATDTQDEDGNWSTTLKAYYTANIYKDASAKAANHNDPVTIVRGSFTPTVGVNDKNLITQCYVHLKTLDDFSSLSDA